MHIILTFLFVVIIIFVFGISIINALLRALFGFGRRTNPSSSSKNAQQKKTATQEKVNDPVQRKKIFDKSEGEYVEFEEIEEE